MALATEQELQGAYRDKTTAAAYVANRFVAELAKLLHDRQVRAVQRVIDRAQPGSTLEIAPGPGRLTRDIAPSGRLTCLEFNEGMIEQGQAACGAKAHWVRGNAFHLPFGPEFDFVYSLRFIRHFHEADRDRLYAEVRRVLKPGGWFVMDVVNERMSRPLREARPEDYPIYDELYTRERLWEELRQSGLEPVTLEPVQKWFGLQYRSQTYLGPRCNWLNRFVIRLLERLPRRQGLEWIVTCRRA